MSGFALPGWVGWLIAIGGFIALAIPMAAEWARQRAFNRTYLAPPQYVPIKVTVRGPLGILNGDELEHFGRCWIAAFDCLCLHGPWSRALLLERLGPGNRVQVMPGETWQGVGGGMVGGELVAGVLRVTRSLDSLGHELIHRAEYVLEHGETDNAHARWPERGLAKVDEAYRAWLAALP